MFLPDRYPLCSLEAQQESGSVCSVLHVSGSTRCFTLLHLQPTLASCHSYDAVWLTNFCSCHSLWEGKILHHPDTHAKIKVLSNKTDVLVQVSWEPKTHRVEVGLEFVVLLKEPVF